MNSRRWVILFFSLIVILFVAFQVSWRVFSVDDYLRDLIIAELQPVVPGEISIEKITVSLAALNFHHVKIDLKENAYQINIKKLQLGFSIFNFLKYNLNPIRVISDIELEEPTLIIHSGLKPGKKFTVKPIVNLDPGTTTKYKNRLIDLGFVGRMILNRGSIIWASKDSTEIRLLNDLTGWISTTQLERSTIRMKGRLFNSENDNIELTGQGNLVEGKVDSFYIQFSDDNLSTSIPTIFPEILKIEGGQLRGNGILRDSGNGFALNGMISIKNAEINLFNQKLNLKNLNTEADIKNWDVIINSCNLNYFDTPVTISGKIENLLNPVFDLQLETDNLNIEQFITETLDQENQYGLKGVTQAKIKLRNAAQDMVLTGTVSSPVIIINQQHIQRVKIELEYQNHELTLRKISALYQGLHFQNHGTITLNPSSKPNGYMVFEGRGNLKPLFDNVVNPDLSEIPVAITGRIEKDESGFAGKAGFHLVGCLPAQTGFANTKFDSIPLFGNISFKDKNVSLRVFNEDTLFGTSIKLQFVDNRIQFESNIDYFGDDLWDLTPLPIRNKLKNLVYVSLVFTGDTDYATYSLIAHRKVYNSDSDKLFQIDGQYSANGKTEIRGDVIYHADIGEQVKGDIDLSITPETILLNRYQLGDFYDASAKIDLTGEHKISGKLNLNKVDLAYIFDGILLRQNFDILGTVSGNLDFSGTLDQPEIMGNLKLEDGIIRATGYYSGDIQAQLINKNLRIDRVELLRDSKKLLDGSGDIDLGQQTLDINVNGKGVDLPVIFNLLVPDADFITGKTDFNLRMTQKINDPNIQGNIHAYKGKLFFVNYDSLDLVVGRSGNENLVDGNFQYPSKVDGQNIPGLTIQQAKLVRGKQYSMQASGFLPFSDKEDLGIHLRGEGNAFAILFDETPFVKASMSESQFQWGFGGTYDNVVYTEGNISLKNGILHLQDLTSIVDNIEIEAELEPVNQFLHFTSVTGEVHNKPFFASTRMDSTVFINNPEIEPLVISDWGINFGVIEVKTGKDGVPLHIPGLMEKGEEGWFVVRGLKNTDGFTISGPAEHPLSRGEILTYNAAFTYPFVEEETTEGPDLTQQILESMVWDVHVMPIKDIRYVKQIPGLIDNVWINSYIDPKISDLQITGIIADETFRMEGDIISTRGNIEYLNLNFNVERFGAEFDKSDFYPIVYGRARTTITDTTTNLPVNIYLTLYVYDKETKQELERARWSDDVRFRLSSDNPTIGINEGQILAALGYSPNTLNSADVLASSTDHLLLRPLFRPVERKLERTLGLDVIRFHSRFARNVMDLNFNSNINNQVDPRYFLFRSTQVMVGKYISNNLYFLYSGQIEAGLDPRYTEGAVGLLHQFDLEYWINPNLLLELQYNYNSLLPLNKDDKRIQIRHSFNF